MDGEHGSLINSKAYTDILCGVRMSDIFRSYPFQRAVIAIVYVNDDLVIKL